MADFGRGIKAGVVTGIVYMLISAILGAIYHNSLSIPPFIHAAQLSPFLLRDLTAFSFWLSVFFPYIVRGVVFGAIFAALYDFLPGTASVKKGVVLSSFLWIVAVIQVIYTTPGWPWDTNGFGFSGSGTYYSGMISLSSVGLALAGIISALAFGALTGFLWNRFRGKELTEERKGRSVLLVSFIFGGLMWALLAIGFTIGVVIGGAPAIGIGSLWPNLLFLSVVFLGLPGWVLALVAWKKTKVDKSGFRWGVAGGVMMALTGIMLLPGVLAIIGGVLSARKSADESVTDAIAQ